jgi:hypothetical protein
MDPGFRRECSFKSILCVLCGDFNASLDAPSAGLMATRFRPTQTAPTAFTALADRDGAVSHPFGPRMDGCIDYHAGVWADLRI